MAVTVSYEGAFGVVSGTPYACLEQLRSEGVYGSDKIVGFNSTGFTGSKDVMVSYYRGGNHPLVTATGIVRPVSDIGVQQWTVSSGTLHWAAIDDEIQSPTVPSFTEPHSINAIGVTGVIDTFYMSSLPNVHSVSSIQVYLYTYGWNGGGDIGININMNGWQTEQTLTVAHTVSSWGSKTFTGTWSADDLSVLQVKLTGNGNDNLACYCMYAVVTYLT